MRLESRDRKLAVVALGLVALWLGWLLLVSPKLETSARAQEQLGHKEKQLARLIELRARWDSFKARKCALEERLGQRPKDFSLTGALQGAAARAALGTALKGVNELPVVQEGPYRRRKAEVQLGQLSLDQLVNYLYEVENPTDLLSIDRLEVRPQANPIYIDATLTVSCLETTTPAGGGAGQDRENREGKKRRG
jgi:type II secretory pathway component PulM